ncbi:hypothetical protein TSMEX_008722 [Taenia solium]|eukprot:TsM_000369000 transcript=TsM_000369000 gene=TsM_000369000
MHHHMLSARLSTPLPLLLLFVEDIVMPFESDSKNELYFPVSLECVQIFFVNTRKNQAS